MSLCGRRKRPEERMESVEPIFEACVGSVDRPLVVSIALCLPILVTIYLQLPLVLRTGLFKQSELIYDSAFLSGFCFSGNVRDWLSLNCILLQRENFYVFILLS